jgi:hypothetical protein
MSFDLLEKLTFLFLAGFFVFSELYFAKRRVWGVVKKILTSPLLFSDLAPKELEVILHDGVAITVQASPCVFCLGNFSVGDKVGITKLGKKHFICPSFVSGMQKRSTCFQPVRVKRN